MSGGRQYQKMMVRGVRGTLSRFLAILCIVALGTGFLCGLLSTEPDMKAGADAYFDAQNAMDYLVRSSLGLSEEDIDALSSQEYIAQAEGKHVVDMLFLDAEEEGYVTRVIGEDFADQRAIGRLELLEGRWPKNESECVVELPNRYAYEMHPGETLHRNDTAGEAVSWQAVLPRGEYDVVGVVRSPHFISMYGESSQVGDGTVAMILYVEDRAFELDYYTVGYVTIKGAKELNTYTEEYDECIEKVADDLKDMGEERCALLPEELRGQGKWILEDRSDNLGMSSYDDDTAKVGAIGKVFPLFFFLVAALVALTTLTRLIDEERERIGTLKSLGYSSGAILRYYLVYGGAAAVLGCLVGIPFGCVFFPKVIANAYTMIYVLPPIATPLLWYIVLPVALGLTAMILLATYIACREMLREKPATLLLPKAPKVGKRILLERITPLWRRVSFSHKVTLRNIFRYKKRFLMTILGVAGCSALLLTGFGIRDSIGDIVDIQFGELHLYDQVAVLTDEEAVTRDTDLAGLLADGERVSGWTTMSDEDITVRKGKSKETSTLRVPADKYHLAQYITLRTRRTKEAVTLSEDGVVLTEKSAENLGVRKGDTLTLERDGEEVETVLTGITENYTGSYTYMLPATYEDLFGEAPAYTTLIVQDAFDDDAASEDRDAARTALNEDILACGDVLYLSDAATIRENFAESVKSIDYIVYVLIAASGALAVIVLYNLTNVNVCERKKELATIRVLGFYQKEVAAYIFREINILSLIGILCGVPLGIWLHHYIVLTVEVASVMFGRTISWPSYLIAAGLTVLFTLLVNLIMRRPIRRIDMVESMKAVD